MRIVFVVFVFLFFFSFGLCDSHEFTRAELKKMRVRVLKKMIKDRGEVCEGCVEKGHLVDKVLEIQHLPILEEEKKEEEEVIDVKEKPAEQPTEPEVKKEATDEFSDEDLDGIDEELEKEEKKPKKKKRKRKNRKEKEKTPGFQKVDPSDFKDRDFQEMFREDMKKKKQDRVKLMEALRKQGIDTSNINFQDDGLGDLLDRWGEKDEGKKKNEEQDDIPPADVEIEIGEEEEGEL